MNHPNDVLAQEASPKKPATSVPRYRLFCFVVAALVLGFIKPLYDLTRFALSNDLYSHIVLIPFVSLYLAWSCRSKLPAASLPNRRLATLLLAAGLALLASYWVVFLSSPVLEEADVLAFNVLAFVLLFIGVCASFFGASTLRAVAFPLGFLVFMVPMPVGLLQGIETFLQHTSAVAAAALFKVYGTPFFRDETFFQLPGMNLEVAPECSGIHSTLALFITSLVAGYLFLRSPGNRTILALAVIPLAIMRNGFRIFVIGELCVHISPDMINSYIHRHGGPIFFALSLVPFFLLLLILTKFERRGAPADVATARA